MESRAVVSIAESVPTLEGAGVRLRRAFGFEGGAPNDPFLLLDDFRSNRPADYVAGFPWHPHRGIETITYVLAGEVEHGDSLGNRGTIGPGDVQWMTAGSGIIHQEMPRGDPDGRMHGFQLWANLPASHKMMEPRYRDVKAAEVPVVDLVGGATVRVVAGRLGAAVGPVRDVVTDPEYLDVTLSPGARLDHAVPRDRSAFAYVFGGGVHWGPAGARRGPGVGEHTIVRLGDGDRVEAAAEGDSPARFLLVSGRPLREPVAWRGPIVMNTEEELLTAFREYREGTFLKAGRRGP